MGIVKAERRQRIAVVKAEVTIAVGIGKGNDTLTAESAVGIQQIGKALVFDSWLDGILHGLLA